MKDILRTLVALALVVLLTPVVLFIMLVEPLIGDK